MNDCENCRHILSGSLTLPWADGDNPYAYFTCRLCGHGNTV